MTEPQATPAELELKEALREKLPSTDETTLEALAATIYAALATKGAEGAI